MGITSPCLQVYAVIKSTLERLALIGTINVDVQEQALLLTQTVGEEIASMIRVQKSLEGEFQRLIELQHTLRHEPNKVKKEVCGCHGIFSNSLCSAAPSICSHTQLLLNGLLKCPLLGPVSPCHT